jgi:hypothetical protein
MAFSYKPSGEFPAALHAAEDYPQDSKMGTVKMRNSS